MDTPSSSWEQFEQRIAQAATLDELTAVEHELFGRKSGALTLALKEMGQMDPETRKEKARLLNAQKQKFLEALEEKKKTLLSPSNDQLANSDRIDVSLELPKTQEGHLHPVPEFIGLVEDTFGRMGFDVWYGPEIEEEELNFDMLNIPETHPARDSQDTFWVARGGKKGQERQKGEKRYVLRTHTSPVQIRYMRSHTPPFRAIFPGKTYRKDADATHSPMFHQFEGLMVGKDISLSNMQAVLITAMKKLISPKVTFRFRSGFFPFVEPGLEMDMMWQGDLSTSREGRWLEMGGCGMVHPNVLKNGGIDPMKWQGFAFGFGIERPLMIKHQIPDLRAFFEGDLRFLKQF